MNIGKTTITHKLLAAVSAVIVSLAVILGIATIYFMDSLTDSVMLKMLQPLSKTAAQNVESNLRAMASHFFLLRDDGTLSSPRADSVAKSNIMQHAADGLDLVWLGLYEANGALATGIGSCPQSIAGRELYLRLLEERGLLIEDSSVGENDLEIVMGLPMALGKRSTGQILAGAYRYEILGDLLDNTRIGNGAAFIVNNETGALIVHEEPGRIFRRDSVADVLGTGFAPHLEQGKSGAATIKTTEGLAYVSFSPIQGTNWSVVIQALRGDFIGATRQAILTNIIITVLTLVFFIFVLHLIISRILHLPLRTITRNARLLAVGQFEDRPAHIAHDEDEIGQLGAAFLSMTDSIHLLINDICILTQAVRSGYLGERADLSAYQGDYARIISGINDTLDIICSHLDLMPSAIILFNGKQETIYRNLSMRRINLLHSCLGENSASLLGRILGSGQNIPPPPEAAALFEPELEGDDSYHAEITLPDLGGEIFNYSLSLKRMRGEEVCVMLILNDVTLLARAKNDAYAASQAKGDFLSRMSHEIRTPMNAIIGMTAIGRHSREIERKEYCLGKINEASTHLLGVINDVLDMSKIEADKFELSPSEFVFENMIRRVSNVISFRVEEKKQKLSIRLAPDIPHSIVADEQRLAQVITNLLSNAAKFTPENGLITLTGEKIEQTGQSCTLRLEVKDTGIGISPDQQAKLFHSFGQADASISRKFGGTGLGLVISKRIIEMMDGRIWVESALGRGASFIFEIKAAQGSQGPPDYSSSLDWKNLRIMAVNDWPENLSLFKNTLEPTGALCDLAKSGAEALKLLAEQRDRPYDLIFIDLHMPGMDGLELGKSIRATACSSRLILCAGVDWGNIEDEARAAGVEHFLQTPVLASSLLECVTECMNRDAGQKQNQAGEASSDDNVFAGKRVLMAEDVDINREIAQGLLEHTGISLTFAVDGLEAVEIFSADPSSHDLILMDVHMPEMDGYEATRRIRASNLPRAADIPILAMTASVFREDVERCLKAGMNGHLGKPIDTNEMIAALKRYLL
ncbi:MAG: response regulator [Desulfovibrionaceae bacterium]|nr:response regulator [Desulfovibrionaceae bacterium]